MPPQPRETCRTKFVTALLHSGRRDIIILLAAGEMLSVSEDVRVQSRRAGSGLSGSPDQEAQEGKRKIPPQSWDRDQHQHQPIRHAGEKIPCALGLSATTSKLSLSIVDIARFPPFHQHRTMSNMMLVLDVDDCLVSSDRGLFSSDPARLFS